MLVTLCPSYLLTPATHLSFFFFFFNDTATTEIYTLSLHDALPISPTGGPAFAKPGSVVLPRSGLEGGGGTTLDRKSTRLNSSHVRISYAVFCLKKKKTDSTDCRAPSVRLETGSDT